jgi:hypothetical protein
MRQLYSRISNNLFMKRKFALSVATALFLPLLSLSAANGDPASQLPPAVDKKDVTFATDIKPIFDASCVRCHQGPKAKSRIQLDTLENVLQAAKGRRGAFVRPGDSAASPIVALIARIGNDPGAFMPPSNNKAKIGPLTKEEVGLIRAWIDQGAK